MYQFPRRKNQLFASVHIREKYVLFTQSDMNFSARVLPTYINNKIRLCTLLIHEMRPSFFFSLFPHNAFFKCFFFLQRHKTRITFSLTCFAARESSSFDCLCVRIKWLEASEIYRVFSVLYICRLNWYGVSVWKLFVLCFFIFVYSYWKLSFRIMQTERHHQPCSLTNRLLCLFSLYA